MTKKRVLLVLAIIIAGIIVAYGVYHPYLRGESSESESRDTPLAGVDDSVTPTADTLNATPPGEQENDNQTNRSTVSIPLDKPPFID